jgi:hypothetical protein
MHHVILKNYYCLALQGRDNNSMSILKEMDRVSKQEANRSLIGIINNT